MIQTQQQQQAIALYTVMRAKTSADEHLRIIKKRIKEIEAGEMSKDKQYENLISIARHISNACYSGLQDDNIVYKKYAMLHLHIPFLESEGVESYISAEELDKAKNELRFLDIKNNDQLQRKQLETLFEAVYASLKQIFKEVKEEIKNG